jgi:Transposase IS116/IS110/IS902 family
LSYSYDELSRLIQEVQQVGSSTSVTATYGYDKVGNRSQLVSTLPSNVKRITTPLVLTTSYSYDPADRMTGNILTASSGGNGNSYNFGYDLNGSLTAHHRFMLTELLGQIDFLDEMIERVNEEVGERMHPFEEAIQRLDTIPGVNRRVAQVILAECGEDMSRFESVAHLASWAGLCPGNHQSAGKRYSGKKVAVVALAHTILVIIYHVLTKKEPYKDLGADYYLELANAKPNPEKRFVHQLEKLGLR